MKARGTVLRTAFFVLLAAACCAAQGVKRLVIVKVDGLPGYYVDKFVRQRDPATGRSMLPWFNEIFYKNGTRIQNFYTRGMSLSGPSWGQLDTGQHLQIKGNVEYDRYTLHPYDYLNFFPYYLDYGLGKKVDMPATEVMDELKIPLLVDAFTYSTRYQSQQLYQRGNDWAVLASGFINMYPGSPGEFIDEWTLGFETRRITADQNERDILGKLVKRPDINYYDYYESAFDHVSHHNNDAPSRLAALKDLDRLIGRIWEANNASDRRDETALVVVSDHGFNSEAGVYSQGFNLVKTLAGRPGGGHHVITKRRLMLDYSIKGLYPLVPLITTTSKASYYLDGQSTKYPTALVDFDGNERSSLHLRNSDLNALHILLQQMQSGRLDRETSGAAEDAFFDIISKHRREWQQTVAELTEEIDALHRWWLGQQKLIPTLPPRNDADRKTAPPGAEEARKRVIVLAELARQDEKDYRRYIDSLSRLSSLSRENFDPKRVKIDDVIAPGAMGDPNSLYQLQNYIVGLADGGLVLDANKDVDLERSFKRVDYFKFLQGQRVRNNVQKAVSSSPIDFISARLPAEKVNAQLSEEDRVEDDPVWLFGGDERQALLLSSKSPDGTEQYKYLAVSGLSQTADGTITFSAAPVQAGFPLHYFEDKDLMVPDAERAAWFGEWHSEIDWLHAIHRTMYSNALIGLNEQLDRHPLDDEGELAGLSPDDLLIRRFRQRQRHLTEADMLVLANNHWNFDVRGFNPGGNHGSFFRVSTNSTFLIAGGSRTGIPRGMAVAEPYDSLGFMPTILRLMGKIDSRNEPVDELKMKGFRKFPGRVVKELTSGETGN